MEAASNDIHAADDRPAARAGEAPTPLREARVRRLGEDLLVERLVVSDSTAVRVVDEREAAGEAPAQTLTDAIEIGARVLDRERTAADTDFVRAEFERAARELEGEFGKRAAQVTDELIAQLEAVFSDESGTLTRALKHHFSDESTGAVHHRVKEVVGEVVHGSREELIRHFSASDSSNPLADFKAGALESIRTAGAQQDRALRALLEKLAGMETEIQRLRDERDKQAELAAERERGTAKGRTYEECAYEALDRIAAAQGDDCEAVGDLSGAGGKVGDVLVSIEGSSGPARGRVVFEAKDSRLSRPEAIRMLDESRSQRDADYAVLVVPSAEELPARTTQLREVAGDKLFVVHDPEDPSPIALEVAYSLARARVLAARGGPGELDAGAIAEAVERALAEFDEVRKVKLQLTGATTSIEKARELVEGLSERVRAQLRAIGELVEPATDDS